LKDRLSRKQLAQHGDSMVTRAWLGLLVYAIFVVLVFFVAAGYAYFVAFGPYTTAVDSASYTPPTLDRTLLTSIERRLSEEDAQFAEWLVIPPEVPSVGRAVSVSPETAEEEVVETTPIVD
jgi:hypothetical protein